jgi:hypothetical protein
MRSSVLFVLLPLVAATVLGAFAFATADSTSPVKVARSPRTGQERPVLVELFTSEGCSSCPPADQLLMELDQAHWLANAEVIVLSEHVDYWNRLGWVDPFSSSQFSDRQKGYAARFAQAGIYTPQMVVDGREELVGSDRAHALRAISGAARQPKAGVVLAIAPRTQAASVGQIGLTVRVEGLPGLPPHDSSDVFLAVTESRLHSQILRGENSGRGLDHTAVVRSLTVLGRSEGNQAFSATPVVSIEPAWKRANLRAVVFVQEPRSGRVLGVAAIPLASGQ